MKLRNVLVTTAVLAALSAGASVQAQPDEARYRSYDFDRLMRSFDASLRSDVPGVVESTIYNLVEYKSFFPNRQYGRLVESLDRVARSGADSTIAYKARLAGLYLAYGSPLSDVRVFTPYDHEGAFKLVSEQLERKFLITSVSQ
ncbi:MAG TPA: hypothetical protein VL221_02600 [Bacteroidota bacterium]|nr:hypothetical protein [Bacteroidota bacterium]